MSIHFLPGCSHALLSSVSGQCYQCWHHTEKRINGFGLLISGYTKRHIVEKQLEEYLDGQYCSLSFMFSSSHPEKFTTLFRQKLFTAADKLCCNLLWQLIGGDLNKPSQSLMDGHMQERQCDLPVYMVSSTKSNQASTHLFSL